MSAYAIRQQEKKDRTNIPAQIFSSEYFFLFLNIEQEDEEWIKLMNITFLTYGQFQK
jgi:hypothetical protein